MNTFEKFFYNLGYAVSYAKSFAKPQSNWIIPFIIGMAAGHYYL